MNRAASVALSPLGGLYGLAMKARRALYRRGLFRSRNVGVPVISVGNVTLGGTGKTPLVEWIARRLANTNRRVCILTRGYGRSDAHRRVIVSNGTSILSDAARAGDEAFRHGKIDDAAKPQITRKGDLKSPRRLQTAAP